MGETSRLKRITRNTLVLFLRISVLTFVNLYAVRLLLRGLGQCDFGIYNAVAGVVTLSACLLPVLSQAIQRFYSYLSGKGESEKLVIVFSTSINVVAGLCTVLFVLFETVGTWGLNTYMTIPADRIGAANIVFQFALLSFFFTLFQLPYTAAIYAHEEMGAYAAISCLDCLLKLAAAFIIGLTSTDKLVVYAACLAAISLIIFSIYRLYAKHNYQECKYKLVKNWGEYKGLLSFTGWSMLGSMAGVGLIQGSAILLNIFFGPLANAAFAIATSIYNAFLSLGNSIVLAFRAPMIKAYASGENQLLDIMFGISNKCIMYLLAAIAIPLFIEMQEVLSLWVGNTTSDMVTFARLMLIYTIGLSLNSPITTIIQASGRIKYYYICTDSMTLMHLPIAYLLLKLGAPSYGVLLSMIGVVVIAHAIRIIMLHKSHSSFDLQNYCFGFLLRGIILLCISTGTSYSISTGISTGILRLIVVLFSSPAITIALLVTLGTNKHERQQLSALAMKFIRRKH